MNPTLEFNIKINTVIYKFKKKKSMKLENPKSPKFYTSKEKKSKEILGDLLLTQSILTQVIYLNL